MEFQHSSEYSLSGTSTSYDQIELAPSYIKEILEKIHLPSNPNVLDFASGKGLEAQEMRGLFGAKVVEAEISQAAYLSDKRQDRNFTMVDYRKLPFPKDYFHLIHCKDALTHIDNLKDFFGEMDRVLKHQGKLVLVSWQSSFEVGPPFFTFKLRDEWDKIKKVERSSDYGPQKEAILREFGDRVTDISPLYFNHSPEQIVQEAKNSGLLQVQGKIPDSWRPTEHEKNWAQQTRNVYLFSKA